MQYYYFGTLSCVATPDPEYQNRLANETTNSYIKVVRVIKHFSKAYEFIYAALWLTMAYLESFLIEQERLRGEASNNVRIEFLVGPLVNQRLPTGVESNLYNISDALNDRDESVWVDISHLIEIGNKIVEKMGDILITSDLLSASRLPGRHTESWANVDLK